MVTGNIDAALILDWYILVLFLVLMVTTGIAWSKERGQFILTLIAAAISPPLVYAVSALAVIINSELPAYGAQRIGGGYAQILVLGVLFLFTSGWKHRTKSGKKDTRYKDNKFQVGLVPVGICYIFTVVLIEVGSRYLPQLLAPLTS